MGIVWIYLCAVNVLTFFVYGVDKRRARKKQRRYPEKTLLTWAMIGGSAGAFAGMRFFRHKTNKPNFYIGVPTILFIHLIVILIVQRLL